MTVHKFTLRLDEELYSKLKDESKKTGDDMAELARGFIREGIESKGALENIDIMAKIMRQQLDITLKPHVERLAALSSKGGHMAATAAFLNVQAFMDLVPAEKRKDAKMLYDKARVKAVTYMKTKAEDFQNESIID